MDLDLLRGTQNNNVKFGYSRDHVSDRSQINVGLSMDRDSGMPIGLTMMPGNVLDVTDFEDTFDQILPLLNKDPMIVFDNGAFSMKNSDLLERNGVGFVTGLELNGSEIEDIRDINPSRIQWMTISCASNVPDILAGMGTYFLIGTLVVNPRSIP